MAAQSKRGFLKTPGYKRSLISFIVSSYDRPQNLRLSLASLALQTEPHEIIVCCNHPSAKVLAQHKAIARQFGAKVYHTGKWGAYCCYSSAEMIIERGLAKGEWVGFPSDDTIVFACFSDLMMRAARENNWDLVYCDCVYDPMVRISSGVERYGLLSVEPKLNKIDKTGFLMKLEHFNGFPGKRRPGGVAACDGLLIEELVEQGIRHGKAPGILLVHQ